MNKKKEYSQEFKEEAVKLIEGGGRSLQGTARDLGIPVSTINGWVRKSRVSNGNPDKDNEGIKALRKENLILKEEREILKKALAIFSRRR